MGKTTNRSFPEARDHAVRMVLDGEGPHWPHWQAIASISAKIGYSANPLNDWVKKVEVDSGRRAGVSTDMAVKLKGMEQENC